MGSPPLILRLLCSHSTRVPWVPGWFVNRHLVDICGTKYYKHQTFKNISACEPTKFQTQVFLGGTNVRG